jgi:hypothetical protein
MGQPGSAVKVARINSSHDIIRRLAKLGTEHKQIRLRKEWLYQQMVGSKRELKRRRKEYRELGIDI